MPLGRVDQDGNRRPLLPVVGGDGLCDLVVDHQTPQGTRRLRRHVRIAQVLVERLDERLDAACEANLLRDVVGHVQVTQRARDAREDLCVVGVGRGDRDESFDALRECNLLGNLLIEREITQGLGDLVR